MHNWRLTLASHLPVRETGSVSCLAACSGGLAYDMAMQEKIFGPLGMRDTVITAIFC